MAGPALDHQGLYPEEAALVRASGRLWLVTPRVASAALREAAARPADLDARRLHSAADRAAIGRLRTRIEGAAGGGWVVDDELAVWLERSLARRRLSAFDVTPDLQNYNERFNVRGPQALSIPGGVVTGPTWPPNPIEAASPEAARHRCAEVLHRACALMEREDRLKFEERLVPESFARAVMGLWRWAGDKAQTPTPKFDAPVFATAYQSAGWAAFVGLDHLARAAEQAVTARNDEELDAGARLMVLAVQALGAEAFFRIMRLAPREGAVSANEQQAALYRWATYVGRLPLPPALGGRGAVWGELTPGGRVLALEQARRSGRMTLADFLERTDFRSRFLAEFGPRPVSTVARRVWAMTSAHFIGQLRGRLTLYVEGGAPMRASPGAAAGGAPPAAASAAPDVMLLAAQLGPGVTEVEVADVGSSSVVVLRRDQVGR